MRKIVLALAARASGVVLLLLLTALFGAPARAVTPTLVASFSCSTASSSCTGNFNQSVPVGSYLVVVPVIQTGSSAVFTVVDSANNCGSSYAGLGSSGKILVSSSTSASIAAAVCSSTTTALTTSNTVTASVSTGSYDWTVQVYAVSGLARYDKAGTAVSGTWTSGTAAALATTPVLGYSSEWALAIVAVGSGATADSLVTYTGGFASVGSINSGNSRPELFLSAQTLTTGTPTLGATPTSAASRAYNSIILLFATSGAVHKGCGGCGGLLLGV